MPAKPDPQRAWLVPRDDGALIELPTYLVGRDAIHWPPGYEVKPAGQASKDLANKTLYRRHRLAEENVYVYVEDGQDPNALPDSIRHDIRRQMGLE